NQCRGLHPPQAPCVLSNQSSSHLLNASHQRKTAIVPIVLAFKAPHRPAKLSGRPEFCKPEAKPIRGDIEPHARPSA
ncbi:MAG: hypothetical protein EBW52_09440, partial [Betaproteobacteria bacterium]|nr:hypothetical protein [Betaproteobacteria bacterium]